MRKSWENETENIIIMGYNVWRAVESRGCDKTLSKTLQSSAMWDKFTGNSNI